jgi:hypothetical protein
VRKRVIATAAAVAVLVAAAAAQGAGTSTSFSNTHVCPYPQFSYRLYSCTSDWRSKPFASNRWICSTVAHGSEREPVRLSASFDGHSLGAWKPLQARDGSIPMWFAKRIVGPGPLPGGTWTCTFRAVGASSTVRFMTHGPTGDVVDFNSCSGTDTVGNYTDGVCRKDESAAIPRTSFVVVSFYILDHAGSSTGLEIVDPDGKIFRKYSAPTIVGPIAHYHAVFYGNSISPLLAAGTWGCRVLISCKVVATEPFSVTQ